MTKALYPKRPALIPMLDSLIQEYLREDDLGAKVPFAERALGLVRGYQRDLHRNQAAVHAVRQDLTGRGYRLTEVRILDLLILSVQARGLTAPLPPGSTAARGDRGAGHLVPVAASWPARLGHAGDVGPGE